MMVDTKGTDAQRRQADRYHAYGRLQPMAPDPWHDRKVQVPAWVSVVLIAGSILLVALGDKL